MTVSSNAASMSRSAALFAAAQQVIAGGVNSPVRAFQGVGGGTPVFFKRAQGAYLFAEDDQRFIDYVGSWGPMILGHNHPSVVAAVRSQALQGLSFGAPTVLETRLAQLIKSYMPAMALLRLVNSGTEATMSAVRLARGFTGRERIIKFAGCYHGHADGFLVHAGSGPLTLGIPSSPGVPASFVAQTISLPYNDLDSVEQAFQSQGADIACVIVEPVAGNMNCIPPVPGFLAGLRRLCDDYGALLIFDEVMTGFRVALGGAQQYYQVQPDLTTLGKIIGGGLPVGAFGGRQEIMTHLAPLGPVYQAGTLSGNPLATAAGIATLEAIAAPDFYSALTHNTAALLAGLTAAAERAGIGFKTTQVGGMFGLFFTEQDQLERLEQVKQCRTDHYRQFFRALLREGVYLAPSAFEAGFVSSAHTANDIQYTVAAAEQAFARLAD